MEDAVTLSEKATSCLKRQNDKTRSQAVRTAQKWLCIAALVLFGLVKVLQAAGVGKRIEQLKADSTAPAVVNQVRSDDTDSIGSTFSIAEVAGVCNRHISMGDYAAAENAHLEAFEKTRNKQHKDFAIQLRMYADTLMHARRFEAAETLYRHALNILETAVGTTDKEYPMTMLKLASACNHLGYFDEEQQLCNRARELQGF